MNSFNSFTEGWDSFLRLSSDFCVAPSPNRSRVLRTVLDDCSLLCGGWRTLEAGFGLYGTVSTLNFVSSRPS